MADDEVRDVLGFHEAYNLPVGRNGPSLIEPEVMGKRLAFIEEELGELELAIKKGDLAEAVDALVDLTYVIKGTAVIMGISPVCWQDLWDEVHKQNMTKVATTDDNYHFGISKPPGWVPPDIQSILDGYGARFKR